MAVLLLFLILLLGDVDAAGVAVDVFDVFDAVDVVFAAVDVSVVVEETSMYSTKELKHLG